MISKSVSHLRSEPIGKWQRITTEHSWSMKFPPLTLRWSWLTLQHQVRAWHWRNGIKQGFSVFVFLCVLFVCLFFIERLTSRRKWIREKTGLLYSFSFQIHQSVKCERKEDTEIDKECYTQWVSLHLEGMGRENCPLKTCQVKAKFLSPFGTYYLPSLSPVQR